MIIPFVIAPVKGGIKLNIKLFQQLIDELLNNGIKVQNLTLLQISQSVSIYKKLYKSMEGQQ